MPADLHEVIAKAIQSASLDVFSTMVGLDLQLESTTTEQRPPSSRSGLVALIGLAGNWSGTGSMACSEPLACRMASGFLSTPYDSVTEEVFDAVGEIANMIIGNVKTTLEDMLGPIGLSTPTLICGPDMRTRGAHVREWTVVTFDCGSEKLFVQMCLASDKVTPTHILAAFTPSLAEESR
jgi:chemotaxis protein CheX